MASGARNFIVRLCSTSSSASFSLNHLAIAPRWMVELAAECWFVRQNPHSRVHGGLLIG